MILPWHIILLLLPLFMLLGVAFSMVGLGGAPAYLALMAMCEVPRDVMVPTALAMGAGVATISWLNFARAGHVRWDILTPGLVASIPAAFLGARLELPELWFRMLISLVLVVVAARMLFFRPPVHRAHPGGAAKIFVLVVLGLFLGFSAGVVGIGGGVFFGPILLLLGWATVHEAAAVSAPFAAMNCLSGLSSKAITGSVDWSIIFLLALPTLLVAYGASRWAASRGSARIIQRVFGVAVLAVAARVLVKLVAW